MVKLMWFLSVDLLFVECGWVLVVCIGWWVVGLADSAVVFPGFG